MRRLLSRSAQTAEPTTGPSLRLRLVAVEFLPYRSRERGIERREAEGMTVRRRAVPARGTGIKPGDAVWARYRERPRAGWPRASAMLPCVSSQEKSEQYRAVHGRERESLP